MPRVAVASPVCPRCLDLIPGTPGGDPDHPHPGPFVDGMCVTCCLSVAKESTIRVSIPAPMKITERLAAHAVAIRPMQVYPRPHYDGPVDGPLRMAEHANDFDGLGREKFWDQTAEERAVALSAIVKDAGAQLDRLHSSAWKVANENRIFARGWLNELERTRSYTTEERKK
jgi:hypothetical protein